MVSYERKIEYNSDGTIKAVSEKENGIVRSVSDEPEYIKFYVKMVSALRDIPMSANSLVTQLLLRMSYADEAQRVLLNGEEIEIICKRANISRSSFERQMSALLERGVIYTKRKPKGKRKIFTGTFYINPHFFAKGDWKNVKQLRSYIRLDAKGGSLLTEMSNEEPTNAIDVEAVKAQGGNQTLLFERGEWLWELDRYEKQLPPSDTIKERRETISEPTEQVIDTVLEQVREADEAHRAESSSADQSEADSEFEILDDVSLKPKSFINGLGSSTVQAFGAEWKGKVLQFKNREQRDAFLRSRKK